MVRPASCGMISGFLLVVNSSQNCSPMPKMPGLLYLLLFQLLCFMNFSICLCLLRHMISSLLFQLSSRESTCNWILMHGYMTGVALTLFLVKHIEGLLGIDTFWLHSNGFGGQLVKTSVNFSFGCCWKTDCPPELFFNAKICILTITIVFSVIWMWKKKWSTFCSIVLLLLLVGQFSML